jgi:hypothetical protein
MCRELDPPVFTYLDFAKKKNLQNKVASPVSILRSGGPCFCIYVLQWEVGSIISPGTGFAFHRLLRFTRLRRRYFKRPPHGGVELIDATRFPCHHHMYALRSVVDTSLPM